MRSTPITNNRGRYKCPYCNHPTYKTYGGALTHMQSRHPVEVAESKKQEEVDRLKRDNERLAEENKRLRQKPPEEKRERYKAVVYCSNCKSVDSVTLPVGVAIEESSCFNCRTRNVFIVKGGNAVFGMN